MHRLRRNYLVLDLLLAVVLALVVGFLAVVATGQTLPTTAPATADATVPEPLVGSWQYGSLSPTRVYDAHTGKLLGHGQSMAMHFTFNPDGTYEQLVYIEVRSFGDATRIVTHWKGTVSFAADTFTRTPTYCHRTYESDGKTKVHEMPPAELAEHVKSERYVLKPATESENGQPRFELPLQDGESIVLHRVSE